MNRLVIIGNGFDMAHGLKTSYMDFINWYWDQRVDAFVGNTTNIAEDILCKLIINESRRMSCWNVFSFQNSYFRNVQGNRTCAGYEVFQEIKNHSKTFSVECCPFFESIMQSIDTKGWVDIENAYYQFLKESATGVDSNCVVSELNKQLAFLQKKLIEYLQTIETNVFRNDLQGAMKDRLNPDDFSTEGKSKALDNIGINIADLATIRRNPRKFNKLFPERTMLLSFNYTATAEKYKEDNTIYNYIHGRLDHPENIIFGYGDELDKGYQEILDKNDNELLRNVKSVKYLETRHYHDLLEFLISAPFQVLIMGHSCGNSDRTLLNTIFEHENCISIKPYYHRRQDGTDNYLELVQNISRNFTNMKLFRDRVVNKEQCQTM